MINCLIYGLVDPRNGQLRYVGRSIHGLGTPLRHARPGNLKRETNLHKKRWIEQILFNRLSPEIVVLEECFSPEDTIEAERHWIAMCKSWGFNLTNKTLGGDGVWGFKHTDATKAKMRKPKSLEARSNMSKGKSHGPVVDQNGVVYESALHAIKALDLDKGHIYKVLAGKRKTVQGYTFKYAGAAHGG